jgi:hypothetical protein
MQKVIVCVDIMAEIPDGVDKSTVTVEFPTPPILKGQHNLPLSDYKINGHETVDILDDDDKP